MFGLGAVQAAAQGLSEDHQAGLEAYRRGDFPNAIESWKQALAHADGGKTSISILVNLGHAYQAAGHSELALSSLDQAKEIAEELEGSAALLVHLRAARVTISMDGARRDGSVPDAGEFALGGPIRREDAAGMLDSLQVRFRSAEFPELTEAELRELFKYLKSISGLRSDATVREKIESAVQSWQGGDMRATKRIMAQSKREIGLLRPRGAEKTEYSLLSYLELHLELARGYLDTNQPVEYRRTLETINVVVEDDLEPEEIAGDHRTVRAMLYAQLSAEFARLAVQENADSNSGGKWARYSSSYRTSALTVFPEPVNRLAGGAEWNSMNSLLADASQILKSGSGDDIDMNRTELAYNAGSSRGSRSAYIDLRKRNERMARLQARYAIPSALELAYRHLSQVTDRPDSATADHMEKCLSSLDRAGQLAEWLLEPSTALSIKRAHGAVLAFAMPDESALNAEACLLASWAVAEKFDDSKRTASVLNDLGALLAKRGADALAASCFSLAAGQQQPDLAARALLNLSIASGSVKASADAANRVSALPSSHAKCVMLMTLGDDAGKQGNTRAAHRFFSEALVCAQDNRNRWGGAYALGKLGGLYLKQGRNKEALELTSRALFAAQSEDLQSADLAFRWTWQMGRILKALGRVPEAQATYLRAETILRSVRRDLVAGYSERNDGRGFRMAVGPFFLELANFNFAAARRASGEGRDAQLREARHWIEVFKASLLEDYFRDRSITNYRQTGFSDGRRREPKLSVQAMAREARDKTAVLYLAPMGDRMEIMAEIDGQIHWHTTSQSSDALDAAAVNMRTAIDPVLADLTTPGGRNAYRAPAKMLYAAIIRPFEKTFARHGVKTLVIVPDGKLRGVPFAALYDGSNHLIDKYSLAIVPDLLLMGDDAEDSRKGRGRHPLLAGLSLGVQGFAPLPGVATEIDNVTASIGKPVSDVLMNEDFSKRSFAARFGDDFDLIHIATHANFSGELDETFVLTYEDKLFPADLEKSVRRLAFRKRPLELLVLSACETAVGDDRAALGLAGIAVKSGAHSAVASLWAVDDAATNALISSFYVNLFADEPGEGKSRSKAGCLREAQLQVKRTPAWSHPQYWAAFTVIGNWLSSEERTAIHSTLRQRKRAETDR